MQKFADLNDWQAAPIHEAIQQAAAELSLGMGKVGMPLRVAITGGGQSPSIDATAELIGKNRCLHRLQMALDYIAARG
jgi:glutamyl-tRNA synthetase